MKEFLDAKNSEENFETRDEALKKKAGFHPR